MSGQQGQQQPQGIFSGMQGQGGGAWSFASGPGAQTFTSMSGGGHTTAQHMRAKEGGADETLLRDGRAQSGALPAGSAERVDWGDVKAQSGVLPTSGAFSGREGGGSLGIGPAASGALESGSSSGSGSGVSRERKSDLSRPGPGTSY